MKKKYLIRGLLPLFMALITLLCGQTTLLLSVNQWSADTLYTMPRQCNNDIKIIMIDKKSEGAYGSFSDWSRQHAADLVEALNVPGSEPAVIGFDINYVTSREETGDNAFAEAAKQYGRVVTASTVNFVQKPIFDEQGKLVEVDELHVNGVEYPYPELRAASAFGFSDAIQDKDSYVRMSCLSVDVDGSPMYNFSYEVYRRYCELKGKELYVPNLNSSKKNKIFGIRFVERPGGYETFSWVDVVNGVYDPAVFKDCIVLVGAYTSGMLDQYQVAIAQNQPMYGVEIHANIIDSMLREQSYQIATKDAARWMHLGVIAVYLVFLLVGNLLLSILGGAGTIVAYLLLMLSLFKKGYMYYPATGVILVVVMFLSFIILKYTLEWLGKHKLVKEFKKYVAKQVLDQMLKDGELSITLGGEEKDIAVLFVDIRGFTTLSESLAPEQVVDMLNEYLALTTECIFKNSGTLDKFIGDATMAVFNAPFDLPDYEFLAVRTGLDIVQGAARINVKIKEKIGREVAFGVGVNCGRAIVGNIGCETRMDYTAIGDTVNTAARLEGKALGGQVVISETLKNRLGDRIITEPLGLMSLKGKSEQMMVYSVLGTKETEEGTNA